MAKLYNIFDEESFKECLEEMVLAEQKLITHEGIEELSYSSVNLDNLEPFDVARRKIIAKEKGKSIARPYFASNGYSKTDEGYIKQ